MTFVPSRRSTSGTVSPTSFYRIDHALRKHIAAHDAPENVDQMPFTALSEVMIYERCRDLFLARAAADIEEVRRLGAEQFDDVHRRHG